LIYIEFKKESLQFPEKEDGLGVCWSL